MKKTNKVHKHHCLLSGHNIVEFMIDKSGGVRATLCCSKCGLTRDEIRKIELGK
jgi:hypothetical protein